MKNLLFAVSALALATPVLAQTASSSPSTATTTTAVPPSDPAMGTDSTAIAPPDAGTPTPDQPEATPQTPETLIASEFPSYDKDADGALSNTEFASWMVALKQKSGEPAMKSADQKIWLSGAFSTADKDKNKAVSLAELTSYLTQKA